MRILVTGGAGFIGSNFIRYLLKKYPGYEIFNVDRLTYSGNLENLKEVARLPMYHFIQGDICNEVEVDALMGQQIEAVVHLAAEPFPNPEESDPARFIRTDSYGTYVLCEAAAAYGVSTFIHVSTAAGYGHAPTNGQIVRPAYEQDELKPTTPDTAARIGGELLALSYSASEKLPVTILRPSAVFGPYQYPDQLMAGWVTSAILRDQITLPASGLVEHDWIHVDDVCQALDILLHARKREVDGLVFNVGSGRQQTEISTVELLFHFLDRPRELAVVTKDPGASGLPVDASKLKRLGWASKVDFHQGISDTIMWYQNHPEWWERLRQPSAATVQPLAEDFSLSDL